MNGAPRILYRKGIHTVNHERLVIEPWNFQYLITFQLGIQNTCFTKAPGWRLSVDNERGVIEPYGTFSN